MKSTPPLALFLTLVLISPARGDDSVFIPDMHKRPRSEADPSEVWRETRAELPSWPADADLIEFRLDGPPSPFRYFIDGKTLEVGADQVVRYTLVAEGRGGGRNVSREGIRCTPKGQFKVYAYGSSGQFSPLEGAAWQPISMKESERYRDALWRDFFCEPRLFKPRSQPDMLRSLKRPTGGRETSGFLVD